MARYTLFFIFTIVFLLTGHGYVSAQEPVASDEILFSVDEAEPEVPVQPDSDQLNDAGAGAAASIPAIEEEPIILPEGLSEEVSLEQAAAEEMPNVFYDADNIVPGSMDSKDKPPVSVVPVPVSPTRNPASKIVVVKKDADAGGQGAQLVAAKRAAALGRYESALEIYNSLYVKNSRDPRILSGKATILQKMDRFDDAIATYQELLDISPENLEARINMLGLMTELYPSVAFRNLVDLNKKHPDHVGIIAQMAVASARLGDFESALKYLGMASSMEPHNAGHLFNMAVISDRAGEVDLAVQYYEKALEVDSIYGAGRSIPRTSVFERLAELR